MVVMAITMVLSAALANPDAQPGPDARAQPDPDAHVHFNGALFKLVYGNRRRG